MQVISQWIIPCLAVGGSNIPSFTSQGDATAGLNDILKSIGLAVGVIILLVAIVKMIMASMEENPKDKKDASLMLAISILFISISQILTSLGIENIDGSTSATTIASNIIGLLADVLTYAGLGLAILAIVSLVLSIAQENPEQQVAGVKLLTTSIGLLATEALATGIQQVLETAASSSSYNATGLFLNVTLYWLTSVITYAGGGFSLVGIFRIAMGIRSEDAKERENGVKFLMVGIALLSIRGVMSLFGLNIQSGMQSL